MFGRQKVKLMVDTADDESLYATAHCPSCNFTASLFQKNFILCTVCCSQQTLSRSLVLALLEQHANLSNCFTVEYGKLVEEMGMIKLHSQFVSKQFHIVCGLLFATDFEQVTCSAISRITGKSHHVLFYVCVGIGFVA